MERNWTNTGSKYNRTEAQRARLAKAFEALKLEPLPESLPAGPGLTIKEVIREFRIPRVTRIAWSGVYMNRYGLYAIEGNYTNGRAVLYVLDVGTRAIPLASDFFPGEGPAAAPTPPANAATA